MSSPDTKWLRYLAEHGSHSVKSSMHGLGCGGGGAPRKDPSDAEMKAMTIGLVIEKSKDRDILKRWIDEEAGRYHALDREYLAPVFSEAMAHQESVLEQIERNGRFMRGVTFLNREMERRLKGESAHLKAQGHDV